MTSAAGGRPSTRPGWSIRPLARPAPRGSGRRDARRSFDSGRFSSCADCLRGLRNVVRAGQQPRGHPRADRVASTDSPPDGGTAELTAPGGAIGAGVPCDQMVCAPQRPERMPVPMFLRSVPRGPACLWLAAGGFIGARPLPPKRPSRAGPQMEVPTARWPSAVIRPMRMRRGPALAGPLVGCCRVRFRGCRTRGSPR